MVQPSGANAAVEGAVLAAGTVDAAGNVDASKTVDSIMSNADPEERFTEEKEEDRVDEVGSHTVEEDQFVERRENTEILSDHDEWATATVTKLATDSGLGLTIRKRSSGLFYVSRVIESSPAEKAGLVPGIDIISVNNTYCNGMDLKALAELMKRSCEGSVTFRFRPIRTATVRKGDASESVGMNLKKVGDIIIVTRVEPNGLVSATDIQVGCELEEVNGTPTRDMSIKKIGKLIYDAPDIITILFRDARNFEKESHLNSPTHALARGIEEIGVASATMEKTTLNSSLGMGLKKRSSGVMYVSSVDESGMAEKSGIVSGMDVVAINNINCTGMSLKAAADMVQRLCEGIVTIRYRDPDATVQFEANSSVATLKKAHSGESVGMSLKKIDGILTVTKVEPNELVSFTDIRVGCAVDEINGTSTNDLSTEDVANLIRDAPSTVTILFRVPKNRQKDNTSIFLDDDISKNASFSSASFSNGEWFDTAVMKASPNASLGFSLRKRPSGMVYISGVKKSSPADKAGIVEGMDMIAVNNINCVGIRLVDVNNLLKRSSRGAVILRCRDSIAAGVVGRPIRFATVKKTHSGESVGMSMKKINGRITVIDMKPNGLLSSTDIKVGCEVAEVNGTSTKNLSTQSVGDIIRDAPGDITILYRDPKTSASENEWEEEKNEMTPYELVESRGSVRAIT